MAGEVLGIDVGGSSVKAGLVDVQRGTVSGTLSSAPTPRPCTPASLMPVLVALEARLGGASGLLQFLLHWPIRPHANRP